MRYIYFLVFLVAVAGCEKLPEVIMPDPTPVIATTSMQGVLKEKNLDTPIGNATLKFMVSKFKYSFLDGHHGYRDVYEWVDSASFEVDPNGNFNISFDADTSLCDYRCWVYKDGIFLGTLPDHLVKMGQQTSGVEVELYTFTTLASTFHFTGFPPGSIEVVFPEGKVTTYFTGDKTIQNSSRVLSSPMFHYMVIRHENGIEPDTLLLQKEMYQYAPQVIAEFNISPSDFL